MVQVPLGGSLPMFSSWICDDLLLANSNDDLLAFTCMILYAFGFLDDLFVKVRHWSKPLESPEKRTDSSRSKHQAAAVLRSAKECLEQLFSSTGSVDSLADLVGIPGGSPSPSQAKGNHPRVH